MCAFSVAVDARPALRAGRLKSIVISGLASAAASLIGFGLAHAFIITPIWNRLLGGAPFALVGGLALAAAFDQLPQRREHSPWRMGVAFGAVMFLALVPATALDTALRLTGLRRANTFETTIALMLAAACGSMAGWLWTHRRNAAIVFGTASVGPDDRYRRASARRAIRSGPLAVVRYCANLSRGRHRARPHATRGPTSHTMNLLQDLKYAGHGLIGVVLAGAARHPA